MSREQIEKLLQKPQTREFQIRAEDVNTEAREFTGIGVPYGAEYATTWFREQFAPGSVDGTDALILFGHDRGQVIGKVIAARDTDAGHEITARLSQTTAGQDAYTLLRDGVLTKLSIGFEPVEYEVNVDENTGEETITHTLVRAREFSLVPFPAYETAAISEVRHHKENTTVDTLTRQSLNEAINPLTEDLETVKRSLALLEENAQHRPAGHPADQFRSIGEYVAAAARGDERALELHKSFQNRAAEGVTSADVPTPKNGENFLGTMIRFVEQRRHLANLFTHAPLPAKGMTVEYAQFDQTGSTFKIGKQANELEDLPGPSELKFNDASAKVETYGGWSRLSRQAIERASLPYLDTLYRGMALRYAQVTNNAVATTIIEKMDTQLAGTDGEDFLTLPNATTANDATVSDWASLLVDASDLFEDRGFESSGLVVSSDIFKALAAATATDGRPLMNLAGQGVTNVAGTLNVTKADGDLLRVPVKKIPGLTNRAFLFDPVAVEVRESAGAPVLLQDDNIINLSREFSLYGYMAVTIPFPGALLPVKIGA